MVDFVAGINRDEALIAVQRGKEGPVYLRTTGGKRMAGASFALRDQRMLNQWFERLPEVEPGVRKWGVHRYDTRPTALPPTLTLYVDHECVELEALTIPPRVTVKAADKWKWDEARQEWEGPPEAVLRFVAEHEATQPTTGGQDAAGPDQTSPNPVSPYPGGSPFPPGKEPSLTHTAKVLWTTDGGLVTDIRIEADGHRPTQFACWKSDGASTEQLGSSISPDCRYHIRVSATKENPVEDGVHAIAAQGHGSVEVRVFGFHAEDFNNPPDVRVSYSKGGELVGETAVVAHPVPEKLKQAL